MKSFIKKKKKSLQYFDGYNLQGLVLAGNWIRLYSAYLLICLFVFICLHVLLRYWPYLTTFFFLPFFGPKAWTEDEKKVA